MYTPSGNVEDQAVMQELMQISYVLNTLAEHIFIKVYEEPDKLIDGMLRYADGTIWNPGSGEGLYVYRESAVAWVFIA